MEYTKWIAHDGQIYDEKDGITLALIPYYDAENSRQKSIAQLLATAPDLLDICEHILESVDNGEAVLEDHEQYLGLRDAISEAKNL